MAVTQVRGRGRVPSLPGARDARGLLDLEVFPMALCIEIKHRQVAELMRDHPLVSEAELDNLIVGHANDRHICDSERDRGIYVNTARMPLNYFKQLIRHEM